MQDYKDNWLPEVAKRKAEIEASAKISASSKQKHNNNNASSDAAKVKRLEAELQKVRRELEQKEKANEDDDDDDDDQPDEEQQLVQVKKQIDQAAKMLKELNDDDVLRPNWQSMLDACKQRKAELEQKRDENKPHSSRMQKAEAANEKAKQKVKEAEAQLVKDHEELDAILDKIRKDNEERDRCVQEADDAAKYLAALGTGSAVEENDHQKLQNFMQTYMGKVLARCNPEQAQVLKNMEPIFNTTMSQDFAPPASTAKPAAAKPTQPLQPAVKAASEDAEMEIVVVDPAEHKKALAQWARIQPTKRDGQDQGEFDELKAAWLQEAPMQCHKKPKIQQQSSPASDSAANAGTGTGKGDEKHG